MTKTRTQDTLAAQTVPFEMPGAKRLFYFPLHIFERRILLMTLDLVAVNGALLLALVLRPHDRVDIGLIGRHPLWFVLLSLLWLFLAYASDAYEPRVAGRIDATASAVLKAGFLTVLIYLLIPYITPPLPTSRWVLVAFPGFALSALLAGRSLLILAVPRPVFQQRAIIIGTGWAGRTIAQTLLEDGGGYYRVEGFVEDGPAIRGMATGIAAGDEQGQDSLSVGIGKGTPESFNVLGNRDTIKDLIVQRNVKTLVLSTSQGIDMDLLQKLMDCLELGVEIIPMPVLYEQLTGRVPIEHAGGHWYVMMPIYHPGTRTMWPLIKRLIDIALASLGLVCLGIVLPIIAAAICLDSPGPIFYSQARVGMGGRRFRTFKFRSMVADAEKGQAVWADEDDIRVTRIGRILRRTHLDEFPQFLNILRGEMSVVGPRPERPEFVERLVKAIPFYRVRHAVRPGMAGWGLVKQGYGSSTEDALLKLQYDLYYIKHQSLWMDIVILLKTFGEALALRGR